jgi:hypothetical protein
MGCDIHLFIEKKDEGGKWQVFDYKAEFANGTYDDGSRKLDYEGLFDSPFYAGRNYNLFAILADVRNGSGFAGCDTGDGFNPIAAPKGLPEDVTPEVKAESDGWDIDGHSHSYFTVAELKAYNWQQTTKHRGWVDAWNFEVWRREGKPNGWSGGISGSSIEHVSNQFLARLIDSGDIQWEGEEPTKTSWEGRSYSTPLGRSMAKVGFPTGTLGADIAKGQKYYTLVEWEETYAESAEHFLNKTLPALEELGSADDVRIVFWFDN